MSVVSKLPDLVIQKIIGIAAEPFSDCPSTWKNALPLLAVCSAWRHAAMPIVYSKVFIASTGMIEGLPHPIHRSQLLEGVFSSNINLVASVGGTQFVRRVKILIKTIKCLRALVCGEDLVRHLRANSWSGIVSLSVKLDFYSFAHDAELVYLETILERQKDFCSTMAKHVPGVVNLFVEAPSSVQVCVSFGRLIVETYLQQLRSLKCSAALLDGIVELPSQMASLSVSLTSDAPVKLPKLNVDILKRLEIHNAPDDFDLISLVDSEKSKSIEFPSLVSLKLEYCTYHGSDLLDVVSGAATTDDCMHCPKILFPRLENLALDVSNPRTIERLLFSGQYCWQNISSLVLVSNPSLALRNDDATYRFISEKLHYSRVTYKENLSFQFMVSRYLLWSMPRISKLSFSPSPPCWFEPAIQNWSIDVFADRLTHIDIGARTELDFPQFSKDLVSLCIATMDESWLPFPYLNTKALQHLQLSNMPYNRFWQIFQNSLTGNALFFDSLVLLRVRFNAEEVSSIEGLEELSRPCSSSNSLIVHCPRLHEIHIDYAHYCGLWSVFDNEENIWSNVSKLYIGAGYQGVIQKCGDSEYTTDERTRLMQLIDIVNGRIACQLPNISDLKTDAFSPSIHAHPSIDTPGLSNKLHTMDIKSNQVPILGLPVMNADSLERLALQFLPPNFSWSLFKTRESLDKIQFGRLTDFSVDIRQTIRDMLADATSPLGSSANDVDNSRLSIHMPRLDSLDLSLEYQKVKSWDADIYMGNVSRICLSGAFSNIAAILRQMRFDSVGSYKLRIYSINTEDEDLFYEVTSQAFSDSIIYCDAKLHLPWMPFDIRVDSVNWLYLTHLSANNTQFNVITSLLPKLVNLRSFSYNFRPECMLDIADNVKLSSSISVISIDILSDDDSCAEYYSDEAASAISSNHDSQDPSPSKKDQMAFACSAYLIAHTPSLRRVSIYGEFTWRPSNIIEKYAKEYPHLSQLEIN